MLLAAVLLALPAAPAAALQLPSPEQQRAQDVSLLAEVGARPDRVLVSVVPGPVVNDELVLVGLDGGGTPVRVLLEQRLRLTGTGDYQVRERGPARSAQPLGDGPPPVTKFGAVVWQGFSPGTRDLAARLVLDPVLEQARLPLVVTASLDGEPLGPDGAVPRAGTVRLRLENATTQPAVLPTATDADAGEVARALDAARAAAAQPGPRLPAAGAGLPTAVTAPGEATVAATTGVPLRVTGTVAGGTVTGPATTAAGDVAGTLPPGATAELLVEVAGPGRLVLDLTAVPALDPRTLEPPAGQASWTAWAAAGPDPTRPGRGARPAGADRRDGRPRHLLQPLPRRRPARHGQHGVPVLLRAAGRAARRRGGARAAARRDRAGGRGAAAAARQRRAAVEPRLEQRAPTRLHRLDELRPVVAHVADLAADRPGVEHAPASPARAGRGRGPRPPGRASSPSARAVRAAACGRGSRRVVGRVGRHDRAGPQPLAVLHPGGDQISYSPAIASGAPSRDVRYQGCLRAAAAAACHS